MANLTKPESIAKYGTEAYTGWDQAGAQQDFNSKQKQMSKKGIEDSMTPEQFTKYCQSLESNGTDIYKQSDLVDKVENKTKADLLKNDDDTEGELLNGWVNE